MIKFFFLNLPSVNNLTSLLGLLNVHGLVESHLRVTVLCVETRKTFLFETGIFSQTGSFLLACASPNRKIRYRKIHKNDDDWNFIFHDA
jgi:hypothetical protein